MAGRSVGGGLPVPASRSRRRGTAGLTIGPTLLEGSRPVDFPDRYARFVSETELIYHAAVASEWEARSSDRYEPSGYASEGFIHLSSADQLVDTLHRHYPGRRDLVLLAVAPDKVGSRLVWEDLYGSGVEFPHLYGPIELAAVVSVQPIPCDDDGRFDRWQPT